MSSSSVTPGVVSERYSVKKLSESEFTISITDVTYGDAGNYTCYEYGHRVTERKVELTVLGEENVGILTVSLSVPAKVNHLQYNDRWLPFCDFQVRPK